MDNAIWRSHVTNVLVDGVSVGMGNWTLTSGNLSLNPALIPALQTPGSKTIAVVATGHTNAVVSQSIEVGSFDSSQSSVLLVSGVAGVGETPVYDLTARDQYGNAIQGYQFNMNLQALNADHTIDEVVTVTINSGSSTEYTLPQTGGISTMVPVTEISGVLTNLQGKTRVALQYFGSGIEGIDYNMGDFAAPVWLDALGNQIFN